MYMEVMIKGKQLRAIKGDQRAIVTPHPSRYGTIRLTYGSPFTRTSHIQRSHIQRSHIQLLTRFSSWIFFQHYRGFQVACQNYTSAIRKVHYCKLTTNYIVTLGRFLRTGNCYTSLLAKGPKHQCHLLKICAECTIWKMPRSYSTDLRWRIVWLYYILPREEFWWNRKAAVCEF